MKYVVQDAGPVSYKDRLLSQGETFEATEEETAGFVQAGYVKAVEVKASRSKSKK